MYYRIVSTIATYIYMYASVCVCFYTQPLHKSGFAPIFLSLKALATAQPKPLKISRHSKSS